MRAWTAAMALGAAALSGCVSQSGGVGADPEVTAKQEAYFTCVAEQAIIADDGVADASVAVEIGIDRCRNDFHETLWTLESKGMSNDGALAYGRELLNTVRRVVAEDVIANR